MLKLPTEAWAFLVVKLRAVAKDSGRGPVTIDSIQVPPSPLALRPATASLPLAAAAASSAPDHPMDNEKYTVNQCMADKYLKNALKGIQG
jgi:hypothetical protein